MRQVLFLYNILLIILSPFAFIIGRIIAYKKHDTVGFGERFGLIKLSKSPRSKSVWFHAASVGEVRSIANLIGFIRTTYPDTAIIITTMTTTGRDEAKNFIKADEAFLLPIENSSAISYLIKLLGVKIFFIVDTEIWPNLIYSASINSRLIMLNGRISQKSSKTYERFGFIFRPILKRFSAILTKSLDDLQQFKAIMRSDDTLAYVGNIKFQARRDIKSIQPINELTALKYIAAASTHAPEEELLLKAFKNTKNLFDKLVIAPRHMNRLHEVLDTAEALGLRASLLSEEIDTPVIIIDSFGMLERLYAGAAKIFIGGSIAPIGGHNIYEALQFSKYIAVGEYMANFQDIYDDACSYNMVTTVKDGNDIIKWLETEDKNADFTGFLNCIDAKNKDTLNNINELIKDMLQNEKE